MPTAACSGIDPDTLADGLAGTPGSMFYAARIPAGGGFFILTLGRDKALPEVQEKDLPGYEQGFLKGTITQKKKVRWEPKSTLSRVNGTQVIATTMGMSVVTDDGEIDETVSMHALFGKSSMYLITTISSDAQATEADAYVQRSLATLKLTPAITPGEAAGERAGYAFGRVAGFLFIPVLIGSVLALILGLTRKPKPR